jgi:hypothetical protein
MRLFEPVIGAALVALLSISGAHAEGVSSLADQYAAAQQIFLGGTTDQQSYSEGYAKQLFAGIEGIWVPMSRLDGGSPQSADTACQSTPKAKIEVIDPFTLLATEFVTESAQFEIRYSLRYGSFFGSYTDVAAMNKALGLDQPGNGDRRLGQLARVNGTASIWRASPDILVIQDENGMPIVWGRCPGE